MQAKARLLGINRKRWGIVLAGKMGRALCDTGKGQVVSWLADNCILIGRCLFALKFLVGAVALFGGLCIRATIRATIFVRAGIIGCR